jgi:hypothetical protein
LHLSSIARPEAQYRRPGIARPKTIDTALAARLIAIVLLVSACGDASIDATAAPALVQAAPGVDAIAQFDPIRNDVPGVITFGIAYDPSTLRIAKPLTRFKRTFPQIAWSADLGPEIAAASLSWVVVRRSQSGVEKTVFEVEEPIDDATTTMVANAGDLALLVENVAGTYVMRYLDSREIRAEGTFVLVK